MATDRYRLKYEFWLEPGKPDHDIVADRIEVLKNDRLFASVIREGIMIISELRQGRVDLLLSLFPWIKEEIQKQSLSPHVVSEGLDLKRELAELKQLIYERSDATPSLVVPIQNGPNSLVTAGPKPFRHSDDEVIVPIKKVKSSGTSAQNFLNSAFNLVQ
jgi:hypothetical protein